MMVVLHDRINMYIFHICSIVLLLYIPNRHDIVLVVVLDNQSGTCSMLGHFCFRNIPYYFCTVPLYTSQNIYHSDNMACHLDNYTLNSHDWCICSVGNIHLAQCTVNQSYMLVNSFHISFFQKFLLHNIQDDTGYQIDIPQLHIYPPHMCVLLYNQNHLHKFLHSFHITSEPNSLSNSFSNNIDQGCTAPFLNRVCLHNFQWHHKLVHLCRDSHDHKHIVGGGHISSDLCSENCHCIHHPCHSLHI